MIRLAVSVTTFIIAISIHEFAHGWVAYLLGDDTAKNAGRLTLNPIAHIDIVGTLLLPVLLMMSRAPVVFGWAKPVPINVMNFRRPKAGLLLTGLAGPASNILLAAFFASLLKLGVFGHNTVGQYFLLNAILISVILGVFNLIPIPPLDGSNILIGILPPGLARSYMRIEPYGFIILLALLCFGLLDRIIWPMVALLSAVLIGV